MKDYRLIIFDLHRGMVSRRFYWLAVPLFFISACTFSVQVMGRVEYSNVAVSVGDMILSCFAGSELYFLEYSGKFFKIPMLWISLLLGSHISVVGYAEEFTGYGQQVFLRSSTRIKWWISKCIWNVITTISYFGIGIFTLIIFAVLKGWRISFENTEDIVCVIFSKNVDKNIPLKFFTIQILVIVIIGCIGWNLFQMYIALYVKSLGSILITISLLLISLYIKVPFLPWRYMMVVANENFIRNKYEFLVISIIFVILVIVSVIGGAIKIKSCDYLVEE